MLGNSSVCDASQNEMFKNDVVSSAPEFLKERIPNTSIDEGMDSSTVTPIINKLLNNANNGSFPELGSSPVSPGSKKKLKDLPHTTTLKGCVAYVDVWSTDATDNRSCVFRNFLKRMGATVAMKFTKEQPITHLVFKDGHKSSLQKAIKRNVKIVTCLWVDRCRVLQEWVDEKEFIFDPTNYKPPKRFREMQPLEPEEALRRSAESLKRRKARFEKKNARIVFQSPLVTNCYSANATPTDRTTPVNGNSAMKKPSVLAMDTPYPISSLTHYFSPSIIYDTPMTDSMLRKMQRYKEGKRVFSPPTSEDEGSEEEEIKTCTISNRDADSVNTTKAFSPIPETQCLKRTPWRGSGIAPPKFDYDEIPETQQSEAPDTPEDQQKPVQSVIEGINEIPETQRLSLSKSDEFSQPPDSPLFSSTAKENQSTMTNYIDSSATDVVDSMRELCLRISPQKSELEDTSQLCSQDVHRETAAVEGTNDSNCESVSISMSLRKKKRKLLYDDEYCEPMSVLLSPQVNEKKQSADGRKILLPKLGYSTFKNVTKTGRYFASLRSISPEHSSIDTLPLSPELSPSRTQSTDFGETEEERSDDDNAFHSQPQTPLGLYDRVKMRRTRLSIFDGEVAKSLNDKSMPKRRKFNKGRKQSIQFVSQAANSIANNLKKRRSTMDFRSPRKELMVVRKPKTRNIVLTNFHSKERSQIHNSVRRFPHCDIRATVSDETTHVVCGVPRRTMNVLRAIAHGSWLLSKAWIFAGGSTVPLTSISIKTECGEMCDRIATVFVLLACRNPVAQYCMNRVKLAEVNDSLSAGLWLDEDSYEIISCFPCAQVNRKRKSEDPTWKNELFLEFKGYIYIANQTQPDPTDIKELITICGGIVVGNLRRAAICIGNPKKVVKDIPVVKESWLLDCICGNELKPVEPYLIDVT